LRHIPLGPGDIRTEISNKDFERKKMPFIVAKDQKNPWVQRLRKNWDERKAPHAMVLEMHRQLKELHNIEDAPEPIEAAFMDWGDDPYGGAVHFWNPGYDSTKVLEEIIQPVPNFPCYICGEAYSTNQTWVEGAFQTAELVLEKFGMKRPKWITDDK
ncbi:MAG: FAD-dependent oxidoreductase, partial [Flavobacteriaceae bacterium]